MPNRALLTTCPNRSFLHSATPHPLTGLLSQLGPVPPRSESLRFSNVTTRQEPGISNRTDNRFRRPVSSFRFQALQPLPIISNTLPAARSETHNRPRNLPDELLTDLDNTASLQSGQVK